MKNFMQEIFPLLLLAAFALLMVIYGPYLVDPDRPFWFSGASGNR